MKGKSRHQIDVRSADRVVCIMSYTSSASGLMSSLMDNHPNVLMFPDNLLSNFEDFWQKNGHLSLNSLIQNFLEQYPLFFDSRSAPVGLEETPESGTARGFTSLGPDRNEYFQLDKSKFKGYMQEYLDDGSEVSRKLFFQAIHLAYSKVLDREVRNPIIVFGLHSLKFPHRFKSLMEDFSDVTFLQMVRNPVMATASRFRRQFINGIAISHFHKFINGVSQGGLMDPSTPASGWRAVRMEDLHSNPKKTMQNICNWIDLPWNDVLLESTINGKQWWNEPQSMQISGFSTAFSTQKFEDYLNHLDSFRLYILLSRKCIKWDYKVTWLNKRLIAKFLILPLLLIPFKVEIMAWLSTIKAINSNQDSFLTKGWFWSRTLIGGFGLGRVALIQAWLRAFYVPNKEVELL